MSMTHFLSFEVVAFSFMFVLFMEKESAQGKCTNPLGMALYEKTNRTAD